MRCMEKQIAPYTSNGPIWTLSLGLDGVAGCGAGWAGVVALSMRYLLKMGGQPLTDMIGVPQQQPSPKGADHGT
ncbi:hypothetical protein D3C85_1253860 [compost metagenome]